jgi:predicted amidohydrolase
MPKNIHIAIASICSKPGAVAGNLAQIEHFARRAAADGADLLLTPEMSVSGYGPYPEILATAEVAGDGPIHHALAALAGATGVVLCAGFVETAGEKRHLAHYVVYPDGHFVVQRKHRVTPEERPLDAPFPLTSPTAEDRIGQPTAPLSFNYFEVAGVRCAISICADAGLTGLQPVLADAGVELQLNPAGAGGRREDRVLTADLQTAEGRAKYLKWLELVYFPVPNTCVIDCLRYRHAMAAVNQCGYDGVSMYHLGHGFIVTPMGEVPAMIHGLPNIERMRPMYTHAAVDVADRLPAESPQPTAP